MKIFKKTFIVLPFLILFASCETYFVSLESLKEQFANVDSTTLRQAIIQGPYPNFIDTFMDNPIHVIKCTDKYKTQFEMPVTPAIEMRVTEKSGIKTIFYFDRTMIYENKLIGAQSRIFPKITDYVLLENIVLIEVQNGRKNFVYLKR